ncbi:hypothetical protein GCM10027049_18210 [Mucilaginibacter puniceus]
MISISGVHIYRDGQTLVCTVNNFNTELESLIREQLNSVWNGFAEIENDPEIYTYQRTLGTFLDRYKSKAEETQKGMIGELLAHILINNVLTEFKTLSVLRNKEDRSIKKGFDIIYHQNGTNYLWYSEVKSGGKEKPTETSTDYNSVLLKRADASISVMFDEKRQSLWESALTDVTLIIADKKLRSNLKALLDNDSPHHKPTAKHNVILVSVLYHCPTEPIDVNNVKAFYDDIVLANNYEAALVFSIQKKTFEKIASFLEREHIST